MRKSLEPAWAKLMYLHPYSPEFFEGKFWSKLKATFKKVKARIYKKLIDGITEVMLEVTESDIRNWFTHCCYCTS